MFLSGVWEPTFIENLLLQSLYIINYAILILIIILLVGIIMIIIKKIKKNIK